MAEDDFSRLQGDSYTGSNYANFTGGGLSPQGNVSDAVSTNAGTNAAATVAENTPATGTTADTPAPTASAGLVSTPSVSKALTDGVVSAALPYAGQVIGQTAGAAIGAGASAGTGLVQGVSGLANKVSGGLIGTSSDSAIAADDAVGATSSGVNAAGDSVAAGTSGDVSEGASGFGAAGAGIGAAAATLIEGGGIKKAATVGVGTGVGTYAGTAIGTAVGGPIGGTVGGFIGGTIGGAIGGRVICTQLVKDGLLSAEDQYIDMEFTFRRLSHIHVRGYLFWARGWVSKMRKSRPLRYRTLKIVLWRLNEIKYQLGLRDKPDWRGKIVRFVMENFCFIVGLFVPDTAESVIYKKENKHVSA